MIAACPHRLEETYLLFERLWESVSERFRSMNSVSLNLNSAGSLRAIRAGFIWVCLGGIALVHWVNAAEGKGADSVEALVFEPIDADRDDRVVPVKVYWGTDEKPLPVVLFSHGLGGSRDNNAYLGEYWAQAGYVAVFMQHAGSDEDVWKSVPVRNRLGALKSATGAKTSIDRFNDVPLVIDRLESWNVKKGHALERRMDLDRIGLCGHSYGAVTTLALAGQRYPLNRTMEDERIDAFLAMSPQPGKRLPPKRAFGHPSKPTLCMTGTEDGSPINAKLEPADRQKVYQALKPGDKFQLVLEGGEHFAFGDSPGLRTRNPKHHLAIQEISLRFWNAYLKDDGKAQAWLQSMKPIAETGLGSADVWEWK